MSAQTGQLTVTMLLEQATAATSPTYMKNPAPELARKARPAPLDMDRVVSCTSVESSVPELALPEPISKYETDPPDCEPLGARHCFFSCADSLNEFARQPCHGPPLLHATHSMSCISMS